MNIQFQRGLDMQQLESAIERIEARYSTRKNLVISASSSKRSRSSQRNRSVAKDSLRQAAPASKKQTARKFKEPAGRPGGLFGIDQEVVTLRGLYGNSGFLTDLRQAESILIHR